MSAFLNTAEIASESTPLWSNNAFKRVSERKDFKYQSNHIQDFKKPTIIWSQEMKEKRHRPNGKNKNSTVFGLFKNIFFITK